MKQMLVKSLVAAVLMTLGAPVWIEKDGDGPMRRLMIAQDTGGAIRGDASPP